MKKYSSINKKSQNEVGGGREVTCIPMADSC